MTSQKDQIKSLIADIETVLGAEKPRTPWIRASETEQQRQALAKVQDYLMSLQQTFDAPGGWGPVDPSTGQMADLPIRPIASSTGSLTSTAVGKAAGGSPEDVLQALLTEMSFLRSSALEPLRMEMDELRVKRDRLKQEVNALSEEQSALVPVGSQGEGALASDGRTAVSEEQLNQFLAALMDRLQERLSVQVTQTLSQLESDHAAAVAKLSGEAEESEVLQLRPRGQASDIQLDEMRELQTRSDQLLVNIESTLQGMFETLQRNIDTYQTSLNEGIENMHSLGRQGEVIVRSLVDHLTQQLGQTVPPEPAFFQPRSAEPTLALSDVSDSDVSDSDVSDSDVSDSDVSDSDVSDSDVSSDRSGAESLDTVTSLDEILPNLSDDVADDVSDSRDELLAASVLENSVLENSVLEDSVLADPDENDGADADLRPEDCIREDGTIDLDLLTLDIDRDEDDDLTPEDVMVDAAVADAQVAATEAEDREIESKVVPTEDAAYLADLTIDDLTGGEDSDLLVDASLADPIESEHSAEAESLAEAESSPVSESNTDATDANLAGVETPSAASNEVADSSTNHSSSVVAALAAAALGATAAAQANDADSATEQAVADEANDADAVTDEVLESSLVPDVPDASDEPILEEPHSDTVESDGSGLGANDTVPADLAAELEAANQKADQIASASVMKGLTAVASDLNEPDLEERVVSDEEAPAPAVLTENAQSLESASIPDAPEPSEEPQVDESPVEMLPVNELPVDELPVDESPIDASDAPLTDALEEDPVDLMGQAAELPEEDLWADPPQDLPDVALASDTASDAPATVEPPSAFDDDLDFYNSQGESDVPTADMPVADRVEEANANTEETTTDMPGDVSASDAAVGLVAGGLVAGGAGIVSEEDPTDGQPAAWFLGIDVGTTGLSAVLMNQLSDQVCPLCWTMSGDSEANRFRLPAVMQMAEGSLVNTAEIGPVGPAALQQGNQVLRSIKPLLKVGIPRSTGEPWVQWSDRQMLPLRSLQTALTHLLSTLSLKDADGLPRNLTCEAVGLSAGGLRRALKDVKGVIVGYPYNWPDTYSFNIREAVLEAGLIDQPEQVFFVEEPIAALLSALPDPKADMAALEGQQPELFNCNWAGGTVVLSAGSTMTEAAIADLPEALDQLIYRDFALRSFSYAGDSLDQDIICQLLHPPVQAQIEAKGGAADPAENSWQSLGLDKLNLPQAGEADRVKRHRLRQRLNSTPLGRSAVIAARQLKCVLQEETQVDLNMGDQSWVVKRKDLEAKVFLPYIQRVNRQVNGLLSQKGLSAQAIKQVVCTGGSASLGAIARWLRQKFPNATIIQDTYSGEYSNSCSRVAYGLANLCHYPHVLDTHRHQYSDYFLLLELLRVLPDQPLPAGGILHLLEQRGINTQACQAHILALIEGHLPPGLVPTEGDRPVISAKSPDILSYQILAELPLFRKQSGQIYIADQQQGERLKNHLEKLLATKSQVLMEPLTAELSVETVPSASAQKK